MQVHALLEMFIPPASKTPLMFTGTSKEAASSENFIYLVVLVVCLVVLFAAARPAWWLGNAAKTRFVFADIVFKTAQQRFGMARAGDDAVVH